MIYKDGIYIPEPEQVWLDEDLLVLLNNPARENGDCANDDEFGRQGNRRHTEALKPHHCPFILATHGEESGRRIFCECCRECLDECLQCASKPTRVFSMPDMPIEIVAGASGDTFYIKENPVAKKVE